MTTKKVIRPQVGFQTNFLRSSADIVIGGGAAGAGKSYALLMAPLRWMSTVKGFGATIFRRTYPQIRAEGALWDTSKNLYSGIATPKESTLEWVWPNQNKVGFRHLNNDSTVLDFQGSQIPFIGFDELTHLSFYQFTYLLSRNRSTCGVNPQVRATCNPDADSWLAKLIDWYVDESGYIRKDRDGAVRFMMMDADTILWGDNINEVYEQARHIIDPIVNNVEGVAVRDLIKSFQFIEGDIYDNKELLKVNPQYLGNLHALPEEEQLRLLKKNWKVRTDGTDLCHPAAIRDMFTNDFILPSGERHITADIATTGSDLFVMFVWDGDVVIGCEVIPKCDHRQVEERLRSLATEWAVPHSRIIFDADGVGDFLSSYIPGAVSFHNAAAPIKGANERVEYHRLKDQCYYINSFKINDRAIYIRPEVANRRVGDRTIGEYISQDLVAVKKFKADEEGRLRVSPKDQVKERIKRSPDFGDALMMKRLADLRPYGSRFIL